MRVFCIYILTDLLDEQPVSVDVDLAGHDQLFADPLLLEGHEAEVLGGVILNLRGKNPDIYIYKKISSRTR